MQKCIGKLRCDVPNRVFIRKRHLKCPPLPADSVRFQVAHLTFVGCVLFCAREETASPTSLDMDASLLPIMEGNEMERIITSMKDKYLHPSLNLVEDVFAKWNSPEEGRTVRRKG